MPHADSTSLCPKNHRAAFLFLATALMAVATATASGQTLVKDINLTPDVTIPSSEPHIYAETGGQVFFTAKTAGYGRELWRSDGTANGTYQVRDINPGHNDSGIHGLIEFAPGIVVFVANNTIHGHELWRSDGTEAGTLRLTDIHLGPTSPNIHGLTLFQGQVYFYANDGIIGSEVYRCDGTQGGTQLFMELAPGSLSASNGTVGMGVVGNELFFNVRNSTAGWDLWKTDGTTVGTTLVAHTSVNYLDSPREFTSFKGKLFFTAHDGITGRELWWSDGTTAGTGPVTDIHPTGSSSPTGLTVYNDFLFFAAESPAVGRELYRANGITPGATLILDLNPGPQVLADSDPRQLTVHNGLLFFTAYHPAIGEELWRTNGTTAGTLPVLDLLPGAESASPTGLRSLGNLILFRATGPGVGSELFSTNGFAAGTQLVADIVPGAESSEISQLQVLGNQVVFSADDQIVGDELWKSDGTSSGTTLIADLQGPMTSLGSAPSWLTALGDQLLFVADDGVHGEEIWSSTGSGANTQLLADLTTGPAGSNNAFLTRVNDRAYFSSDASPGVGREIWSTDGTVAGTKVAFDLVPGPIGSNPAWLTPFGDLIIMSAYDANHGTEPWVADTTTGTYTRLADLAPGTASSLPNEFYVWGGRAYFEATIPGAGHEMCVTDGTPAGTQMITDLYPGGSSGFEPPYVMLGYGDYVYFRGATGPTGSELFRTDGTAAGTSLVHDLESGAADSYVWMHEVFHGQLIFSSYALSFGNVQLMQTDGTANGLSSLTSPPLHVTGRSASNDDLLLFVRSDQFGARLLWKTDGTLIGTQPVLGLAPPISNSITFGDEMIRPGSGPSIVFDQNAGLPGHELWISDGTAAGTNLLADIAPGNLNAQPEDLTRVGGSLFFTADDGDTGRELHRLSLLDLGEYVAEPLGAGCVGTNGVIPRISAPTKLSAAGGSALHLDQMLANTSALVLFGTEDGYLPLAGGCALHLSAPLFSFAIPTGPIGEQNLPISPLASLAGLRALVQTVVFDPNGAYLGQASFSNGLELVFGS